MIYMSLEESYPSDAYAPREANYYRTLRVQRILVGLYAGYFEIEITEGVESPGSIPIKLDRPIPWNQLQRHDVLQGTTVVVGLESGMRSYEVLTDFDSQHGHTIIGKLISASP